MDKRNTVMSYCSMSEGVKMFIPKGLSSDDISVSLSYNPLGTSYDEGIITIVNKNTEACPLEKMFSRVSIMTATRLDMNKITLKEGVLNIPVKEGNVHVQGVLI